VVELAHVAGPRVREQRSSAAGSKPRASCGSAGRAPRGSAARAAGCPRAARAAAGCGSRSCSGGTGGPGGSGRRRPRRRGRRWWPRGRARRRDRRDEPTRSNSPVSSTRRSLPCWLSGTLAISSRKSVPPSASSKRPTRSSGRR
jgi:hypothetical protein